MTEEKFFQHADTEQNFYYVMPENQFSFLFGTQNTPNTQYTSQCLFNLPVLQAEYSLAGYSLEIRVSHV